MDEKTLQESIDITIARVRGGAFVSAAVSNGVVTLIGSVQDRMRRLVIERELRQIPEVLDVRNRLRLPRRARSH